MLCIYDEKKIKIFLNEYIMINIMKLAQWMGNEANIILTCNNAIKLVLHLK